MRGMPEFETYCDEIDVTSMSRPDTSWNFRDKAGHIHCWHSPSGPADHYDHRERYDVPTLVYVVDSQWIDEFGYECESGHSECKQCGEHITPRRMADTHRQTIPGFRHYVIDGESVSPEEFAAKVAEAQRQ
jgi:hypothetical protein